MRKKVEIHCCCGYRKTEVIPTIKSFHISRCPECGADNVLKEDILQESMPGKRGAGLKLLVSIDNNSKTK